MTSPADCPEEPGEETGSLRRGKVQESRGQSPGRYRGEGDKEEGKGERALRRPGAGGASLPPRGYHHEQGRLDEATGDRRRRCGPGEEQQEERRREGDPPAREAPVQDLSCLR